ncbi:MAG: DUF3761 domain-containing protein [Paludibacter sp.]|nr:DUF3761 domain-containing protein [Paludibacter sp.]
MKKLLIFIELLLVTVLSFGQLKVTTTNINFRSTPEISHNTICVIPKGTTISILKNIIQNGNWIQVEFNGKIGYIHHSLLKRNHHTSNNLNSNGNSAHGRIKYYLNSSHETVQSPTFSSSAPSGACAQCNDGSYSFSRSRRGTCSHHGGVKKWLN